MKKHDWMTCVSVGLLLASGCGGDQGASSRGDDGLASAGLETGDGVETAEGADGDSEGPTTTTAGDGDGDDPSTSNGESPTTAGDGDGDSDDGGQVKWDTVAVPDAGNQCGLGGGGNEEPEFSFLWAANSSEGTISKIDTKTVTEVGRFIVRPDSAGSPSRTSVSLSGHVAVANRNGGVTKIYADTQFCQESNGIPGIQTSTTNAALPWGEDECVAWHKPMTYASQRPVAWGPGVFNQGTCQWEEEELWTSGNNQNGSLDVYVLDGDDGATKEMISIPTGGANLNADFYGIYGAAVDGNGDFWGSQLGSTGKLVRVNRADMTYDIWDTPDSYWYGMTVDNEGIVWLCSSVVGRFDPLTETWQTASVGGLAGCMADASDNGLLWMADYNGLVGVNRDTLQVEKNWPTGGSYGVSIDFEGYVWTVAFGNNAHKVDPDTGQVWTYGGLVGAYTYSDMTGYALSNAGTPSG